MPEPTSMAVNASKCSSIATIQLDIVKTFSSSPTIFPVMFSLDKAFGLIAKT
jgi:hypothetical protein